MGDWNWGNVQSCGGGCLVVGDKLYFYVSGRGGKSYPGCTYTDAGGSTGLAILRRDGFASMDAGSEEGVLTTRPVRFSGRHLFVNLAAPQGQLQAEVLDEQDNVIPPFSRANCAGVSGDKTRMPVTWRRATMLPWWKRTEDLSALRGRTVKLRFYLRGGSLYSFWVSPEPTGASHGYVAAGGPGFTGPVDTVGGKATAAK
jgi:hypothetical protein